MVIIDFLRDLSTAFIARIWPLPACPRKIATKRRSIEIPFLVGQRVVLAEPAEIHLVSIRLTRLDETSNEFVATGVVARRRINWQAIRFRAETKPVAVGHYPGSGFTGRAGVAFLNQRQQAT